MLLRNLIAIVIALPLVASAQDRFISEMDLHKFVWIADAQISPDGSQIVFVRVSANAKGDGYDTALWMVPSNGSAEPRRFTSGDRDGSPRWSPDGKQIAFIRNQQLHLLPLDGGEARKLTELIKGVSAPAWSPNGKTIAFTSGTLPTDTDKKDDTAYKSDVRVITDAIYRFNGQGYLDPTHPSHIWSVSLAEGVIETPKPKQLTSGEFDENNPQFSKDGSKIYFTSNRVKEAYYFPDDEDLYSIPSDGGSPSKVIDIDGTIGPYTLNGDGKRIAFVGAMNARPVRSYDQPDLFIAELAQGSTAKNLTASYDFDIGAGLAGDQRSPRGGHPRAAIWSSDGKALFIVAAEHGRANLRRIDAETGKVEHVTTGDQEIVSYTMAGEKVAMLISTSTNIGDLFVLDLRSGRMNQITRVNQSLFSGMRITAPEEFWYTSFDGKRIQGWIQKPPNFDASKKYPMIFQIHGGPHTAYGTTFTHEFQWMAAKGYVVVYTNPRGSTSYGQDFANIIQFRYPGDDYRDLMLGVDEVLKRGYVDANRLGVTGGSGGGLLTNWVITQTNRFKAAVSQRSISDWYGFWFTADFTLYNPTWFKGAPWEDPKDFAERSPITHVAKVTTPLMLIEGENDMRTPPGEGGEAMFRALKYLKKDTVMIRFPEETHELSRSGKPWHRVERLQHIVSWFDKYL